MKKILLIGDSIRQGYQAKVIELLDGKAEVTGPGMNCAFSGVTLFHLKTWLGEGDYDVIHWNNGQWDTCHMLDGATHTPLPIYLDYQQRIATILKERGPRVIFATTSPVWPEQFNKTIVHPRRNEDIIEYNRAVVPVMKSLGVEINDLHTPLSHDIKRYICDDMVHLSEDGAALCAECIVNCIESEGESACK